MRKHIHLIGFLLCAFSVCAHSFNYTKRHARIAMRDGVRRYTEIYEPKLAAYKTSEELKEVISEANMALNSDPLIRMATDEGNEYGLFYNYFIWYEGMGYVVD